MKKPFQKGDKKVLHAWAFYDWANSVYSLVIASAVFPLFYGALFSVKGVETWKLLGVEWESSSTVSYTHLRAHETLRLSRMPSSA